MAEPDDQSATLALLARPETYGVSGPVERIDTHCAAVFLAGDLAYKLKRAVHYPYLDFSTLEKRKAVCEVELALNRRTAPDLYLAVEFVGRRADGTLALGEGTPVDWLVVMRRFPADCLLDTMARRGPLDSHLVRDLADTIAAFHDAAEVVPGPGGQRIANVIAGNRAAMAALLPDSLAAGALPAADCEALHAETLAALARVAPLLDARAAAGCVRHCHGDLHLANICVFQGRPLPFDCLEFDDELATTDVLYDLAFLLMDLWSRDHHAEAALLFNRYCDMRGEGEGLAALPLFLSVRAAVRAHVEASSTSRQPTPAARDAKLATARAYLTAARNFLTPASPRLISIGGLSGTGKSTLASLLAPRAAPPGARWLRTDTLRKRLAGIPPETRLDPSHYTAEHSRTVYAHLLAEARTALAAGVSVIVDGVFAAPAERTAIAELAAKVGVPFIGLWLEAPPATLRARVTARTADASDATAAVVDHQLTYQLGDLTGWHRIDASGAPQQVLALALSHS